MAVFGLLFKLLGLPQRTALPDNDSVEDAVREYIDIFCGDTQPAELAALRGVRLSFMAFLKVGVPITLLTMLFGIVWLSLMAR